MQSMIPRAITCLTEHHLTEMNLHFAQRVHFLKVETKVFNWNYQTEIFYIVMQSAKDEYIFQAHKAWYQMTILC